MGVFAVTEIHDLVERKPQSLRESFFEGVQLEPAIRAHSLQSRSDRGIVCRRGGESLLREPPFCSRGKHATRFRHLIGNQPIISRRSNHSDILKIFRRGTDHGRPANIDIFNQLFKVHARLGCSFLKGIKIYNHHVDRLNTMFRNRAAMRGILTPMQNASVNLGVERLHAAIQHLWKSS